MGGAHAHDSHGHGHGAAGHDSHAHGGEIPPAPEVRSITPSPEDFQGLPGAKAFAWPLLWMVLGFLGIVALLAAGWSLHHMDAH